MSFTEKSLVYLSKEYRFVPSYGAVGSSASAGGAVVTDNEVVQTPQTPGFIYQEVFTADGISNSYTVTENGGQLSEVSTDINVYRNGLLLNDTYISSFDSVNGIFELTFTPDLDDRISVVWFVKTTTVDSNIFQEIFNADGSSSTFSVTKNGGLIPNRKQELFLYINGIFLDYEKVTTYSPSLGQFTLNFTPSSDDTIAAVWFVNLPQSVKIIQEQFIANGTQTTFTVTKNGGELAKTKDAILLMRNGQHINNDYITGINTSSGTITLTFAPDSGDDITLIWFVEETVTPTNSNAFAMFQEEFTADGTTPTFTVTQNEGKLPEALSSIMIYRNGQYISNSFISSHDYISGSITFGFIPRSGEKITIVWVLSNL